MHKPQLLLIFVLLLFVAACQPIRPLTPVSPIQPPTPVSANQTDVPVPTEGNTATVEADPSAAERLLEEGTRYFDAEDYDKAIASFTEAVLLDPDLAEAYVKRAATNLRLREFEPVIPDCNAAIRINPNNADAHLYCGIAYDYTDDFEAAVSALTEAIRLNPQSVDAHVYRGAAYFFLEHYADTVQDCTDAIRLSGGYFLPAEVCLNVMGTLVSPDFEHREAAIQDYDEAIALNPDFAAGHLFRGLTNRTLGNLETAIQDLELALKLEPSLGDLLIMYWGPIYSDSDDPEALIEEFETALSLVDPNSLLAVIIENGLTQLRFGQ